MTEKTDKFPAFQFYPGDWRKDAAVQSMSFHDRAVWFEMMCMMHEPPERGVLLLPNGRPMSDIELSRNLGLSLLQTRKSLVAILESGTGSRREDGAILNRRMVKDEALRKIRKECGSLGGNPDLVNQNGTNKDKQPSKQTTTPSSSPSSSPASSGERERKGKKQGDPPAAENRAGRPPDLAADLFADSYLIHVGNPYGWQGGDFPQMAKLRKRLKIGTLETPESWGAALIHYFGTPLSKFSLQHFATDFDTFKNSPLDRFGKPINHANSGANGNGRPKDKDDINRENAQRLLDRLDRQDREREQCDADGSDSGGLSGTAPDPAA